MIELVCEICGRRFAVKPYAARTASTCSMECRQKRLNAVKPKPRQAWLEVQQPRLCACGCGGTIEPKPHHKYQGIPSFLHGHNTAADVRSLTRRERSERMTAAHRAQNYRRRIIKRHGYVYLLRRDHPAATKQGYVAEHRIVMERLLGRPLLPAEVVHHRNGQTGDNRPENLALFASQSEHLRLGHDKSPAGSHLEVIQR